MVVKKKVVVKKKTKNNNLVKIGDKITIYGVFNNTIAFLPKKKIMIINKNLVTFENMNLLVKQYIGVNRIHKPISITFYSDWKNKKLTKDSYEDKVVLTFDKKLKKRLEGYTLVKI